MRACAARAREWARTNTAAVPDATCVVRVVERMGFARTTGHPCFYRLAAQVSGFRLGGLPGTLPLGGSR